MSRNNLSPYKVIRVFFIYLFIYLFLAVLGLRFCEGFLQLRQAGATLHRGARASHYRGLSCCRAQAPDTQAQQLWLTGLVAPRHVGSSQTRARTRVPCISRQILNHCATREAPIRVLLIIFLMLYITTSWLIYFITVGFYLLFPFTYFSQSPCPPLWQSPIFFSVSMRSFSFCFVFQILNVRSCGVCLSLFHLAYYPLDLFILLQFQSFLRLSNTPLYMYDTSLSNHLWMDISVASISLVLYIMLQ